MKILIVDDHALFQEGLKKLLLDLYASLDVVVASNADQAIELVGEQRDFDLVLLDLMMPGMNGLEGLGLLRQRLPDTPVVVVSASNNQTDIQMAFQHGAKGFIVKSSSAQVLEHALVLVLSGETYIPSEALISMQASSADKPGDRFNGTKGKSAATTLTPRQKEVLMRMARGQSNKEIARCLDMLEGTVKVHAKAIYQKLGVHNRTQAVITGVQIGWLPRSEIF